jgi:tetratricopeptide (TPR) repeat protein
MFSSCRANDEDGAWAFANVYVIYPPSEDQALVESRFYEIVVPDDAAKTTAEIEQYRERARSHILFHFSANLDGNGVVERLRSFRENSAVIVVNVENYETGQPKSPPRQDSTSTENPSSASPDFSRLESEDWARSDRIARLAKSIVEEVSDRKLIVILLSQSYAPVSKESEERLLGVDGTGVTTRLPPPRMRAVAERREAWSEMLIRGDVESVIAEIDDLPLGAASNAVAKAQILHAIGRSEEGFQLLRPRLDEVKAEGSPELIVRVAVMADRAGEREKARGLLQAAIAAQIQDESTFNIAIDLARRLEADAELRDLLSRINNLLPLSDTAIQAAFFACESSADYRAFANRTRGTVDGGDSSKECRFLYNIAVAFAGDDGYDPNPLLDTIRNEYPESLDRAVLIVARHELSVGRPLKAATLCREHQWRAGTREERDAVRIALSALEGTLLQTKEAELDQATLNHLLSCFHFVASYLYLHPAEASLRLRFAEIVAPHSAGLTGIIILVALATQGPKPDTVGTYEVHALAEPIPSENFLTFFQQALELAAGQKVSLVGHGPLPEISDYDERRLLDHIWRMISGLEFAAADDDHCDLLIKLLHVGLLLASRAGRLGEASALIGRIAISLATSGYAQMARDLAEHILLIVSDDEDELLAAWLEYAEIYVRSQRPHEAIAWLCIALSRAARPWPPQALFHASLLSAKILRELSIYDLALEAIRWAKDVAKKIGISDRAKVRIEVLESSIEISILKREGIRASEQEEKAMAIAERLSSQLSEAREEGDEVLPIASLLASLVTMISTSGLDIDSLLRDVKVAAEALEGHAQTLLLSLLDPPPTAEAIAAFAQGLRRTRYQEYASTDVSIVPILARRSLAQLTDITAGDRLVLLEWLTDRSVQVPKQGDETVEAARDVRNSIARTIARGRAGAQDLEELTRANAIVAQSDSSPNSYIPPNADMLASFAADVSREGVDIHSFALVGDPEKTLILVSAVDGEIVSQIVSPDLFSSTAFINWKTKHPYNYGFVGSAADYGVNDFEWTLQGIGLPLRDTRLPALLVPAASLQILPPNLVLSNGMLSGIRRPMASAPSLSWLQSVRELAREPSGRRVAWIPLPREKDKNSIFGTTLDLLSIGISETLVDNKFLIHSESYVPTSLRDADLAVVGAHGSVHATTEWFRAVADEEELRFSPTQVADALSYADVVILFICSAGRIDAHPFASAAMGLPQMLLGRGCRAVLASPWPLDARVPRHWLPAFLAAWEDGATAVEANFVANETVAHNYSHSPSHRLAMNLFGDPLVTRT